MCPSSLLLSEEGCGETTNMGLYIINDKPFQKCSLRSSRRIEKADTQIHPDRMGCGHANCVQMTQTRNRDGFQHGNIKLIHIQAYYSSLYTPPGCQESSVQTNSLFKCRTSHMASNLCKQEP